MLLTCTRPSAVDPITLPPDPLPLRTLVARLVALINRTAESAITFPVFFVNYATISSFASSFAHLLPPFIQPLQEATDPETGRRYLQCEYNRDASSYRSPWSNKYDPPLEDGFTPGDRLRQMEASVHTFNLLGPTFGDHLFWRGALAFSACLVCIPHVPESAEPENMAAHKKRRIASWVAA